MAQTRIEGNTLYIPVWDTETQRFQSTPEKVEHTLLGQLFTPTELEGLVLVKTPRRKTKPEQLKNNAFDDGILRQISFSSGHNHYFAPKDLWRKIKRFFHEADTACRYGSLLASNCYEGIARIDRPLHIKVVDYSHPGDAPWRTGDCHGKISGELAAQIGGVAHLPLQFRLAYPPLQSASQSSALTTPFLAKGTLIVDESLTTEQGYDLVLDQSSIKGIPKQDLNAFIPCGDYELSEAVMGNRQNAKATQYSNSWQFTVCYSAEAIAHDFGEQTREAATQLARLQHDPITLRDFILRETERKYQPHPLQDEQLVDAEGIEPEADEVDEPAMIRILRADTQGLLLNTPKVQQFMQDYLRRQFLELATKGAYKHDSGMALPSLELRRGHVCVPHLPPGETVIVTRSPIPSSDNIRKYHNVHLPTLTPYKNTVWMHPDDAAEHHQGDFDGDQMQVSLARKLPAITRETKWADEPRHYAKVEQRSKLSYQDAFEQRGEARPRGVPFLGQVAAAASQEEVGIIASYIGKVQSSEPNATDLATPQSLQHFEQRKTALMNRLIQALQIEVDFGKSAERHQDIDEDLKVEASEWETEHPVPFFTAYKKPNLYKRFPMPTEGNAAINVLPRIVNSLWQQTQQHRPDRRKFQELFITSTTKQHPLWERYCEVAREQKDQFNQDSEQIRKQGLQGGDLRKAYKRLYEQSQAKWDKKLIKPHKRQLFQQALWYVCHTDHRPSGDDTKACMRWAMACKPFIEQRVGDDALSLPTQALPFEGWVLSTPFGDGTQASDKTLKAKQWLERHQVRYTALMRDDIPFVDFALHRLSPPLPPAKVRRYRTNSSRRLTKRHENYTARSLRKLG